jgi:hypothetical protein
MSQGGSPCGKFTVEDSRFPFFVANFVANFVDVSGEAARESL